MGKWSLFLGFFIFFSLFVVAFAIGLPVVRVGWLADDLSCFSPPCVNSSEVDSDLVINSSGSVDKGALSSSGTLGFDWADNEVSDTLTASNLVAASSVVSDAEVDNDITIRSTSNLTVSNSSNAPVNITVNTYTGGGGLFVKTSGLSAQYYADAILSPSNTFYIAESSGDNFLSFNPSTDIITVSKTMAFGNVPFTISSASQISNLNASYSGIAYDLSCTDCIGDTEIGSVTSTDLSCTDCIGPTEITDSYVLNTDDTMSGSLTVTGNLTVGGTALNTIRSGQTSGVMDCGQFRSISITLGSLYTSSTTRVFAQAHEYAHGTEHDPDFGSAVVSVYDAYVEYIPLLGTALKLRIGCEGYVGTITYYIDYLIFDS